VGEEQEDSEMYPEDFGKMKMDVFK